MTQQSQNLQIDGERLWSTLMETAEIGKTALGGVKRLTLTDLDRQVRDWFKAECEKLGCAVTIDALGTMYATRPGKRPELKPIACGSHLDTQPTGGKFDGILGVLAGLEVLRTLHDAGYETEAPFMVVNWTNEEGSRFAPAMLASGVYAGAFTPEFAYGLTDADGVTLGEALDQIGYRGAAAPGAIDFGCFLELHIEQGPILEDEDLDIGVVAHGQGTRWSDVVVTGRASHAGTTPMPSRQDALAAAASLIGAVRQTALDHAPAAVATVGALTIREPSRNTIPGEVRFTLDMRNPSDTVLDRMEGQLDQQFQAIAASHGVTVERIKIWDFPAVSFDAGCVAAVRDAAQALGYSHRTMISGAGHDACYVNRVCPTGMVFVPCKDGISHNELEDAKPAHCAAGTNVLLRAMLAMDQRLSGG